MSEDNGELVYCLTFLVDNDGYKTIALPKPGSEEFYALLEPDERMNLWTRLAVVHIEGGLAVEFPVFNSKTKEHYVKICDCDWEDLEPGSFFAAIKELSLNPLPLRLDATSNTAAIEAVIRHAEDDYGSACYSKPLDLTEDVWMFMGQGVGWQKMSFLVRRAMGVVITPKEGDTGATARGVGTAFFGAITPADVDFRRDDRTSLS